jgi:hypothetical protein
MLSKHLFVKRNTVVLKSTATAWDLSTEYDVNLFTVERQLKLFGICLHSKAIFADFDVNVCNEYIREFKD